MSLMDEEIVYRPDPVGTKKLTWTSKFLIAVLVAVSVSWSAPRIKEMLPEVSVGGSFLSARNNSIEGQILLNREYFFEVKKKLQQAQESIRVMMYVFRIKQETEGLPDPALQLADILREKADDGVDVKVILSSSEKDSHIRRTNKETAQYLKEGGVKTKVRMIPGQVHAKLVFIDEDRLFISNHNWTWPSLWFNQEAAVYFEGAGLGREAAYKIQGAFRRNFEG